MSAANVCRVCKVVQGFVFQPNTAMFPVNRALRGCVWGVQGCRARRRIDIQVFRILEGDRLFIYAIHEKACTPYTLCTYQLKQLIYIYFICVGFVLGWVFFVLGSFFGGSTGR